MQRAMIRPILPAAMLGLAAACGSTGSAGMSSAPAAALTAEGCVPQGKAAPVVTSGRLVRWCGVGSADGRIRPRAVTIWLPPGYDRTGDRYPVLYTHDGQNAFSRGTSNFDQEWRFDETLTALERAGHRTAAIVVAIDSAPARHREYLPQGLLPHLPPAIRDGIQAVDAGPPLSDAYVAFVADVVKPRVDATFRTRADPAATGVIGASMGGLISLEMALSRPDVFGQAAALSPHWPLRAPPTPDPAPGEAPTTDQADVAAVAEAFDAYLAERRADPARTRLYLDHGTGTLDAWYPPYAAALDALFARHGFREGRDFASRRFTGAPHNETAWAERLDIPLLFLDPARGVPAR